MSWIGEDDLCSRFDFTVLEGVKPQHSIHLLFPLTCSLSMGWLTCHSHACLPKPATTLYSVIVYILVPLTGKAFYP